MKSPSIPNLRYRPSHPWYFRLGGVPFYPSQIKAKAVEELGEYSSLMMEDIETASNMAEPKRSERLRAIREKVRGDLRKDLYIYQEKVRELRALKSDPTIDLETHLTPICSCVFTALGLKHSHLYHDYAQLMICEQHLAQQADLFAML